MSFLTELADKIEVHCKFETPGYYLTEEDQEAIIVALRHLEKCYATSERSTETCHVCGSSRQVYARNPKESGKRIQSS